jgi:hypothetical protein
MTAATTYRFFFHATEVDQRQAPRPWWAFWVKPASNPVRVLKRRSIDVDANEAVLLMRADPALYSLLQKVAGSEAYEPDFDLQLVKHMPPNRPVSIKRPPVDRDKGRTEFMDTVQF